MSKMYVPLKAVIFDLDGTLINSAIPFKEMKIKIITFFQAKGVTFGLLNENLLNFEIVKLAVNNLQEKGFSRRQITKILSQVSEIMNEVELQSIDNASLIEDAAKILNYLKLRGLRLGVMTRSCHEYAQKILTKFGLDKFFDALAARDDVSQPKPNPEHAFYLLNLLGVKAEETLFIGDCWSDAECASQAKLRFVFVGRTKETAKVHELGYKNIDSLNDLINIIETA